jgi:hypothetical protein
MLSNKKINFMKQIISQLYCDIILDTFIVIHILTLTYFFFKVNIPFLKKKYIKYRKRNQHLLYTQ